MWILWDVVDLQILTSILNLTLLQFNQSRMCHSPVSCVLINLFLFWLYASTSPRIYILILLCCSAWSKRTFCTNCTSFITLPTQHFSNVIVVSSDHTAYCMGFCFRLHCMCRTQHVLKRLHILIIKMVHRYS